MRRIGMLTSGGDCQALNATMRGVAKSLYNMFDDVEIIGFEDGYKGLMYADYQIMKSSDFSGSHPGRYHSRNFSPAFQAHAHS